MSELLPGQPTLGGEPVFREPWEAQAFAMAVRLHEQGVFTWPEWAAALGEEIARAANTDPDDETGTDAAADTGETYYHHWLATLERLVAERGVAPLDEQDQLRAAWRRAADRTPHGQPIVLTPDDRIG